MKTIEKNKPTYQDFIEWINDYQKLSFYHLIIIILRIRVSVLITILSLGLGYSYLVYQVGAKRQIDTIGIALGKPFHMSLDNLENYNIYEPSKGSDGDIKLSGIHLVYDDEGTGLEDNEMRLFINKVIYRLPNKPVINIGNILATKADQFSVPWQPSWTMQSIQFLEPALAQQSFDWHGRENDSNFYERKVNSTTIRRFYYDCWILEYKIDSNGNSIDGSFYWIKKGQSFFGYCF